MGCYKLDSLKRLRHGYLQKMLFLSDMHTTRYFSLYHANSIALLYLMHKYKKTLESTKMSLTHSKILIFASFFSKGQGMVVKQFIEMGEIRCQLQT